MSTAILNVWITNIGDASTIANDSASGLPHSWVVAVSHLDSRVVNWSEGRYRHHRDEVWTPIPRHTPSGNMGSGWWYESIPTKDGHVEIELPPGSYSVRATMHSWFVNGHLFGNWATDRAIVHSCCGAESCVTLFAPSAISCFVDMFEFVIPLLIKNQLVDREDAENAVHAMAKIMRPELASKFEKEHFATLRRAFSNMGKPISIDAVGEHK